MHESRQRTVRPFPSPEPPPDFSLAGIAAWRDDDEPLPEPKLLGIAAPSRSGRLPIVATKADAPPLKSIALVGAVFAVILGSMILSYRMSAPSAASPELAAPARQSSSPPTVAQTTAPSALSAARPAPPPPALRNTAATSPPPTAKPAAAPPRTAAASPVQPRTSAPAAPVRTATVYARGQGNVRFQPSQTARLVKTAAKGERFDVLERHNGWLHVRDAKKITGWIRSDLITDTRS